MKQIKPEQLEKARNHLGLVLAKVQPGGKLAPVRSLIRDSGTTRAAIEQAISHYESTGLLQRRDRVGLFRRNLPAAGQIIDLVACSDEGYTRMIGDFLSECFINFTKIAGGHGFLTRIHSVSQEDSVQRYVELANLSDSAGYVIVQANMREVVTTFQRSGKPVVCLFPQGRFLNVSQVIDAVPILEMQMNHLVELGHSRILYIREEYPFYQGMTMLNRRLEYYKRMAQNGFHIPQHWQTHFASGQLEKALTLTFSGDPKPTALIVYDTAVEDVYSFLQKGGLEIGKDVSVIATDGSPILERLRPTVTTVVSHSNYTLNMVWKLFEMQLRGEQNYSTQEVLLTFKKGDSTGKPR